ncbi:glycosyltransferase family 2 protein [Snodgrassella communis]|uniref:glycosyltransferase family 2 protein n=1 Tax=Snodgrassella communis TaxID=2946699 RepID=UPI001EF59239|nr:glycosyltransferase family 2 protein [Snodgrassella communis]
MQLSILIPVYNVAAYLPDLLQDLLPKLPLNAEIIFYDDASPDNSIAIVEEFMLLYPCVQIRILRGNENIGLTKAREQLLLASNANYVWFVDSDDKVNSAVLTEVLLILSQEQPDVLVFDYDVFYDGSNQLKHHETLSFYPKNNLVQTSGKEIYRTAILDGRHYFWNKIFRRELIIGIVSYDIPAYEDIAYTPILLSKCQSFYYLAQVVVHYRIRKDSIAQKLSLQQVYGLNAYIQQALYADKVVGDKKCQAYLLYKAHLYYFRLCRKLARINLPEKEKEAILLLAKQQYAEKPLSTCATILLLMRTGMWCKTFKLGLKSGLARLSGK